MKKYQITYWDNLLKQIELRDDNIYQVLIDCMHQNIFDWMILKIELIPETINI